MQCCAIWPDTTTQNAYFSTEMSSLSYNNILACHLAEWYPLIKRQSDKYFLSFQQLYNTYTPSSYGNLEPTSISYALVTPNCYGSNQAIHGGVVRPGSNTYNGPPPNLSNNKFLFYRLYSPNWSMNKKKHTKSNKWDLHGKIKMFVGLFWFVFLFILLISKRNKNQSKNSKFTCN